MSMLNNFLAAFGKPTPSPLYGKSLVYLLGSDASNFRPIPGSVVEPPYSENVIGTDEKIAYLNLFNEQYEDQSEAERALLGPYLHDSDTAEEYGEGQIDPAGPGWLKNLTTQFTHAAGLGYKFAELDNPDAYNYGVVAKAITMAHSFGLGIIAKNPKLTGGALAYVSHPNVFGVIVERGAGTPHDMNELRKQARKDGLLPVWFVFDGQQAAQQCAEQVMHGDWGSSPYKGMSVTYSTGREKNGYNDSHTLLLPIV